MTDSSPGERSIDLHSVDEDRLRDHLEGGDFLHLHRRRKEYGKPGCQF